MLNKNNFFKDFSFNKRKYRTNLIKAKFFFNNLLGELKDDKNSLLKSYEKNYKFHFSKKTIKKFSKYKNIIIIGMGGSILGTKSIYSFLKYKIKKKIFFFDNLDENLYLKYRDLKKKKDSCFIVVSKSGNTLETITNLGIIFSKRLLKNKLIIITELKDSNLMSLANKYNAEVIEHKNFISGRYSVLSESGMFPASLMGFNLSKFKNLNFFIKNKTFVSSLIQNVASIHTLNNSGFKNSVILNYNANLNNLTYWYQQLVAESLGKKGKGINPIISFAPKDHHSLFQLYLDGPKDKFFTFINCSSKQKKIKVKKDISFGNMKFLKNKSLEFIIKSQYNASKNIFKLKNIPFRQFNFEKNNEHELGKIFTFFALETILLARLMNVNPFDQPAVEQIKIETRKFLK